MNKELLKSLLGMSNHADAIITTLDGREIERIERTWVNRLTVICLGLMFAIGVPAVVLVFHLSVPGGN